MPSAIGWLFYVKYVGYCVQYNVYMINRIGENWSTPGQGTRRRVRGYNTKTMTKAAHEGVGGLLLER
jgi:hypothetical protein